MTLAELPPLHTFRALGELWLRTRTPQVKDKRRGVFTVALSASYPGRLLWMPTDTEIEPVGPLNYQP